MTWTISSVKARLVAMCAEIDGVKTSFDYIPRNLLQVQCPAFIIYTGPVIDRETEDGGRRTVTETREYLMRFFIQEALFGTTNQAEIAVEPFFDRVQEYFFARPGLKLDTETAPGTRVLDSVLQPDTGTIIVPYPNGNKQTDFIGIDFPIHVTFKRVFSFKD